MAKRSSSLQNNLPLMVVLAMVVFVLPLTVFSVVYHSYSLKTEASYAAPQKDYLTVRGEITKTRGVKGEELLFLTTKLNKTYKLTGNESTLVLLRRLVNQNAVVAGWYSDSGLFVTAANVAK